MTVQEFPLSATREICQEQCGAWCCKNDEGYFNMTLVESMRFMDVARQRNLPVTLRQFDDGSYAVVFEDHRGNKCPMLGKDNLCTIYAQRPSACRNFPTAPAPKCLLWPEVRSEH